MISMGRIAGCLAIVIATVAAAEKARASETVRPAHGQDAATVTAAIQNALFAWAEAFNAGRTGELCALFAPDLVARVRGEPARGRTEMCAQFRRTAGDRTTRLTYAPAIEDVTVGESLAVASVTWALRVERGVVDSAFVERAQYVFAHAPGAGWQVVRLFSYLEPSDH